MRTRQELLAWAAGFIDGEGSFGIQRQKGKKDILYLQAGQTDRRVLDKLRIILGDGKVYGPYSGKKENWSEWYYYRLTGNERVKRVYKELDKYLSAPKREQYGRSIRLETEPVLKTDEP